MCPASKFLTDCPKRFFGAIFLFCVVLVGAALVMQQTMYLVPCPMCILQRFVFVAIGLWALLALFFRARCAQLLWTSLIGIFSLLGLYLSARQSWIQWYPPEFSSCGRDFYNILQYFSLGKALPLLLQGTGECTQIDWSLFGLSMANYAFIAFALIAYFTASMLCKLSCCRSACDDEKKSCCATKKSCCEKSNEKCDIAYTPSKCNDQHKE